MAIAAKVIIIAKGTIFGPFEDVGTARDWRETHDVGEHWSVYSIWERETGTIDKAHACGSLLERCCR